MRNDWYLNGSTELYDFFQKEYKIPGKTNWLYDASALGGTDNSGAYFLINGKWKYEEWLESKKKRISFKEFEQMFYNQATVYELW